MLCKHSIATVDHAANFYAHVQLAEKLHLSQFSKQFFLVSLVVLLLLRLLCLALILAVPPLAVFLLSGATAVPEVLFEFISISILGGGWLVGGDVQFPAKVDFIWSYLLGFLVLFELIPVNHLISQVEGIAWLLLRLLLRQLQMDVPVRKILVCDFQALIVLILEYFFEEGRLDTPR